VENPKLCIMQGVRVLNPDHSCRTAFLPYTRERNHCLNHNNDKSKEWNYSLEGVGAYPTIFHRNSYPTAPRIQECNVYGRITRYVQCTIAIMNMLIKNNRY
jgi:hypothetical protein